LTSAGSDRKMPNMDLKSVLGRDTIALHLKGKTKEELIDELLAVAVRGGKVSDIDAARKAVLERERRMSTGMKHGIAIPHGKTDCVKDLVACIGVSDEPVDFDALDRQPCRIFIMTLSPADKTGPHLQFLAEVSLLFRSDEKRSAILAAKTPDEVLAVLIQ
jgi:mannitol/fructose-specific phosphotransferase system IIA component (Ntr-type)